jgi:CheY-like chemotaxis protein
MKIILYAEDEPDDVFFMERAFTKTAIDARLVSVPNGAEAVAYLAGDGRYYDREEFPLPHLILLDLNMPQKNGFDVLKWIRATPHVCNLPVMVLTSSNNDADRERSARLGTNVYVVKPSQPEKLAGVVHLLKDHWLADGQPLFGTPLPSGEPDTDDAV